MSWQLIALAVVGGLLYGLGYYHGGRYVLTRLRDANRVMVCEIRGLRSRP